jgi:hypothetical protein
VTVDVAESAAPTGPPAAGGETGPIFIVGPSRSGTSLMRALLNAHSDIALAGETHYFDDLRTVVSRPDTGPLSDTDRQRCEDYVLALSHRPFGHVGDPDKGWLSRAELRRAVAAIAPSADAHFEAYCRLMAAREHATRWGEKTPRHIFRTAEIIERYPDARIICMIRDPRGVIASYRGWENQGGFDLDADPEHALTLADDSDRARRTYDLLLLSLLWRSQASAILEARRRFGSNVHVERYETIVEHPEQELEAITTFLDIDFQKEMLDVPVLNSSFEQFESAGGISKAPLQRWRSLLSDREIGTIQHTCGSLMDELGFERLPVKGAVPGTIAHWARLPLSVTRAALANRDRMGNRISYVWHRLTPLARRHA